MPIADAQTALPSLLPTTGTNLRRSLDQWFDENAIRPRVVGEMDDSALLKVFGARGAGLFPAPSVLEKEIAPVRRAPARGHSVCARTLLRDLG